MLGPLVPKTREHADHCRVRDMLQGVGVVPADQIMVVSHRYQPMEYVGIPSLVQRHIILPQTRNRDPDDHQVPVLHKGPPQASPGVLPDFPDCLEHEHVLRAVEFFYVTPCLVYGLDLPAHASSTSSTSSRSASSMPSSAMTSTSGVVGRPALAARRSVASSKRA